MAVGPALPELDRLCFFTHAATHRLTEELVYRRTYPSDKPGGNKLEVGDLDGDSCIIKGLTTVDKGSRHEGRMLNAPKSLSDVT